MSPVQKCQNFSCKASIGGPFGGVSGCGQFMTMNTFKNISFHVCGKGELFKSDVLCPRMQQCLKRVRMPPEMEEMAAAAAAAAKKPLCVLLSKMFSRILRRVVVYIVACLYLHQRSNGWFLHFTSSYSSSWPSPRPPPPPPPLPPLPPLPPRPPVEKKNCAYHKT